MKKWILLIEVDTESGLPTGKWRDPNEEATQQSKTPTTDPDKKISECGVVAMNKNKMENTFFRFVTVDAATGQYVWRRKPVTLILNTVPKNSVARWRDNGNVLEIVEVDGNTMVNYHVYRNGMVFGVNMSPLSKTKQAKVKMAIKKAFPELEGFSGLQEQ